MGASGENRRLGAVRALLTDLHDAPITVVDWERLGPRAVARVLLGGPSAARTVIVKWVRVGPAQTRAEPWRLRAELAALQFLSEDLGLALAPRVIAADKPAGLLVLEDLAPRVALDRLIRRDGAAAHAGRLAAFARTRGELSAATRRPGRGLPCPVRGRGIRRPGGWRGGGDSPGYGTRETRTPQRSGRRWPGRP